MSQRPGIFLTDLNVKLSLEFRVSFGFVRQSHPQASADCPDSTNLVSLPTPDQTGDMGPYSIYISCLNDTILTSCTFYLLIMLFLDHSLRLFFFVCLSVF